MRIVVDDVNHTVQVYTYHEIEGQMVETSKSYTRRQPVIEQSDNSVSIAYHPRQGGKMTVTVDDTVYEATVEEYEGGQDLLAKIASQITLDGDSESEAVIESHDEGDKTVLVLKKGKITCVQTEGLEHQALPNEVEDALHRHISGY